MYEAPDVFDLGVEVLVLRVYNCSIQSRTNGESMFYWRHFRSVQIHHDSGSTSGPDLQTRVTGRNYHTPVCGGKRTGYFSVPRIFSRTYTWNVADSKRM